MENLKIDVLSLFCQPVHRRGWETHFQTKKFRVYLTISLRRKRKFPQFDVYSKSLLLVVYFKFTVSF